MKLLIGGTILVWVIWMFAIAFIQGSQPKEEQQTFLPTVGESSVESSVDDAETTDAEDTQVFIPAVTDSDSEEMATDEPEAASMDNMVKDAVVYTIDSEKSVASYSAVEEFFGDSGLVVGRNTNQGLNTAVGETRAISGEFAIDFVKGSPKLIGGEFSADLLQLTSVQPHRDKTLKRYWLESNKFPTANFEITEVPTLPPVYTEGTPAVFPLTGILTVREIEKEVTFDVVATLEGDELEALATADLMFEDFGIAPPNMANVLQVEDSFRLLVSITAVTE